MTDIIERLEDANGELLMVGNDFSVNPLLDAAKEIESLRKRVKELEAENAAFKSRPIYEPAPYWTNPNGKMPVITYYHAVPKPEDVK